MDKVKLLRIIPMRRFEEVRWHGMYSPHYIMGAQHTMPLSISKDGSVNEWFVSNGRWVKRMELVFSGIGI